MRFYREFGWTPEELRRQRASDVMFILNAWGVEAKIREARGKNRGK
jgi:hypothetical protein